MGFQKRATAYVLHELFLGIPLRYPASCCLFPAEDPALGLLDYVASSMTSFRHLPEKTARSGFPQKFDL